MYYFYDCFSWFAKLATTPSPPKQKNSAIVDEMDLWMTPKYKFTFHNDFMMNKDLNLCKV